MATYLKQFGRYGIDPSGRPWDVIYRDHIDGKHHDIKTDTHEELIQHVQEETLEQIIHPEIQAPKVDHLSYLSDETSGRVDSKAVPKIMDTKFDDVLEGIAKDDSPKKTIKKKEATAKANATKEKDSGSFFVQVGSYVQKTNAHNISKELTKHGRAQVVMENTNFYTVQLGPFPSQAQAKKIMGAISQDGHHGARITK